MDQRELQKTVAKALDSQDSFPKAKHVRTLVMNSQNAYQFQHCAQAIIDKIIKGDSVAQIKGLVVLYELMTEGPDEAATDKMFSEQWITTLENFKRTQQRNMSYEVFLLFTTVLRKKMQMHSSVKNVPGSMDYELFKKRITRNKISDIRTINPIVRFFGEHKKVCIEAYEKIIGVLSQKKILSLVSMVVCLTKELVGIYYMFYEIIFSTFVQMHSDQNYKKIIASFNEVHSELRSIFDQISTMGEVTALIHVPQLSIQPPDFNVIVLGGERSPSPPPKEKTPPLIIQELPPAQPQKTQNELFDSFNFDDQHNQ